MSAQGTFTVRRSIRVKLLALSLGMMAVAVLLITATAIDSAQTVGRRAQQISREAISAQAEESLKQFTLRSAKENDLILDQVSSDLKKVASYAAAVFQAPERFENKVFWPVKQHMFAGPDQQFMNGTADITSVFVPNTRTVDEEVLRDIELSAYLELVLEPTFKNNPNAEAVYFATPRDVVRYYPNVNLGEVLPPDFRATERVWFSGSSLQNNPGQGTWWTPVYADATGLGLVTTAAIPVYSQSQELIGVVGFDISLREMKSSIETANFLQGGYSFLIDKSGRALALPEQGYRDILGRPPEKDESGSDLMADPAPEFVSVLDAMLKGESGFQTVELQGRKLYVAYAPLKSTGWSLGSVAASENILQGVFTMQAEMEQSIRTLVLTRSLPVIAILFALLLTVGSMSTSRVVKPIQKLAEAARKIGAGEWEVEMPPTGNDEIGLLAHTFENMKEQLRGSIGNLEQRVQARTQDLERRSMQIQTAAEVARDITSARALDELLDRAVHLVRDRFGFYHAGIFLVDDLNEYAWLKAATGDAGRRMLESHHRLKVGEVGLVGYATGKGQPRIALDVGADAVHFKNPLLPATRSELALPLKVGGRVIGALDVQSTAEGAFSEEDITILQTLTDQLAVAIENVRLVEKLEATLEETNLLYQRQVQENWSIPAEPNRPLAYEYDRLGVKPVDGRLTADIIARLNTGKAEILSSGEGSNGNNHHTLLVPLMLRDQLIGVIGLEHDDPNHHWTPDEIAVVEAAANQATLTLENARLLEETQHRASREQIISEITSRMRQSLDIDSVLQTAVREIGSTLGLNEVSIRLNGDGLRSQ